MTWPLLFPKSLETVSQFRSAFAAVGEFAGEQRELRLIIDADKPSYHHQSRNEIGSDKPCSRHFIPTSGLSVSNTSCVAWYLRRWFGSPRSLSEVGDQPVNRIYIIDIDKRRLIRNA